MNFLKCLHDASLVLTLGVVALGMSNVNVDLSLVPGARGS
jgi:hypothetical protein